MSFGSPHGAGRRRAFARRSAKGGRRRVRDLQCETVCELLPSMRKLEGLTDDADGDREGGESAVPRGASLRFAGGQR